MPVNIAIYQYIEISSQLYCVDNEEKVVAGSVLFAENCSHACSAYKCLFMKIEHKIKSLQGVVRPSKFSGVC